MGMNDLPISPCLPDLVRAVAAEKSVVLKAPPGAGKTTAVPPALLSAKEIVDRGQVLLVQPRRLATRSAAARLAEQLGSELGDRVGYHVRFDRQAGKQTKLLVVTTGILLRRLQTDPLLEHVSCVILDEFHERSLEMDLALGMLQRIRTTLRPELKLVVMSATLEPEPIVAFLGNAVAIESTGRSFPVEIRYTHSLTRRSVDQQVVEVFPEMLAASTGHMLIFLPGVGEIRRTARALRDSGLNKNLRLMELYGDMSAQDQDAVLAPSEQRKIILATNVAETSITIPGVTGVIDSGQARVMRYEANVGLSALRIEPISQASAQQRSGRAGRTQPGVCMRLWPASTHRARREFDSPEIERADFSTAALILAAWGERDTFAFPWLTPPPPAAVESAQALLTRLDAVDQQGTLTKIGTEMLSLPLHPRMARFMIAAQVEGVAEQAAIAAALLTERDPFRTTDHDPRSPIDHVPMHSDSDLVDRVEQLEAFFRGDRRIPIQKPAAMQIRRVAKQLGRSMTVDPESSGTRTTQDSAAERLSLRRALLAAFPDRVARRRQAASDRGRMVGGRGVRVDAQSAVKEAEYFLCLDVDGRGSEATVRRASAIEPDWLDSRLIREVDESFFQPGSQSITTRRRRYFDDLLLGEVPIECKPNQETAKLLYEHARTQLERLFPKQDDHLSQFVARVRFLSETMPELDLPSLDPEAIEQLLLELCYTRTSFAALRSAPWLDHLQGRFSYEQLRIIDTQAPARLTVPSGNSIRIHYAAGKPPVMEVRLQELFGWKSTPRVAAGRVRVQLHLLGPNHRPQQITEDLENFWSQTYVQVRKDLRRRYPKHHWPEDPASAAATRNGLKPK